MLRQASDRVESDRMTEDRVRVHRGPDLGIGCLNAAGIDYQG